MSDEYRKRVSRDVRNYILREMHGEMPEFAALLAEFDALECEVKRLRAENEELRERCFRLNEDLPHEEWRDVVGYEGLYQVSNYVRLKSFLGVKDRIIFGSRNVQGYMQCCLYKNGVKKAFAVHRIVAEAFVPNPDPAIKTVVHHKDNNKCNNRPENLEWVTQSENVLYAYRDGLKCGFGKRLSPEDVRYIRANSEGLTQACLAKKFGVSVATIAGVQRRRYYKDVK